MLYAGTNIQSSADQLKKIPVEYLYHSLVNPKQDISMMIRQLRNVRDMDEKKYKVLKKQLPYITCGCFNPPYRRTENFAFVEYFIIDIDHLSQKQLDLMDVRSRIQGDSRVMMCFLSPGMDGLKVLFRLSERCYDSGVYSLFYKSFVQKFAIQYNLEQVVDSVTSDVARACFISMDPDAYYNPECTTVSINDFVTMEDPLSMFDLKRELEKSAVKQQDSAAASSDMPVKDPDKETMLHIRQVLAGKKEMLKERTTVYVPEMLNEIIEKLKSFIEDQGVQVYEIVNIQYAKKIRCKLGVRLAEVNLFYGKHGFKTVISPKTGTSQELNEIVAEIISVFLQDN